MNILIIIDSNNFDSKLLEYIKKNLNNKFIFLLIDTDKYKFEKLISFYQLRITYELVDTSTNNSSIINDYHSNYTDLVSFENIKKIINKFYNSNFLDELILLSDLHEKNHLKSDYNDDYIKFRLIDKYLNSKKFDSIYLKNINSFLKDFLRNFYLKNTNFFFTNISFFKDLIYSIIYLFFSFIKSILYKIIFLYKKIDYKTNYIFQSYFPYLDKSNYSYYLEDQCLYFNKISNYYKQDNLWMLHSIKNINTSKYEFLKYILFCKSNITLLENEILLFDYIKILIKFLINLINYKKINYKIKNENNKFNFFIRYNFAKSLISKNLIYSLISYYSYKNLFNKTNLLKKFIYLFENQSWEKAANINMKTHITTIGYNHTSVSNEYLFFSLSSLDFNNLFIKKSLPDIVAANSNYSKLIIQKKFNNINTVTVEALRHKHLTNINFIRNKPNKNIFFLFSINKKESLLLNNFLNEIINDNRFNSFILNIKFHPSNKINFSYNLLKRVNIISDIEYKNTLNSSKYIICGTTSSSIEAAYSGSIILIPEISTTLFKPPIFDFKDFIKTFKNTDDLYNILINQNIINNNNVNNLKLDYWNIDYLHPLRLKKIIDE